jgi:hypothetical protein
VGGCPAAHPSTFRRNAVETKKERTIRRAREVLWTDRELLLPHVIEHRCPVGRAVEQLCETARWEYLSYLTAAVFDDYSLIQVTGK